jgi:hypothetical protein
VWHARVMSEGLPDERSSGPRGSTFEATRWSLVYRAGRGELAALAELLTVYEGPVDAFLRSWLRWWWPARGVLMSVEDLRQGFFALMLKGSMLELADESRGRFRSLLLISLKRYVIQQRRTEPSVTGEQQWPEDYELLNVPTGEESPQEAFDLKFAQDLLESVSMRLAEEWRAKGRAMEVFWVLYPLALRRDDALKQREAAERLGKTVGAVGPLVTALRQAHLAAVEQELISRCGRADAESGEVRWLLEGRADLAAFNERRAFLKKKQVKGKKEGTEDKEA